MSLHTKSYSKNTLKEAFNWLDKQEHNWSKYIKDSNIAIQMYMKSQKEKEKKKTNFQKELQGFLKENIGAISTDFNNQPPANKLRAPFEKNIPSFLENKDLQNKAFTLDEKSLQALEKTKKELNISCNKEALKILIQLGQKSLNRL
ncbi:MAG: hypothetical protein OXC37_00380 [Bdellovibrionaceae bacterium]|nr:hypothetical protein [Pseudobdellovibrionaceae bacterium]